MVQFRANKIKQIDSNKVAPEFTVWCNKKADCLYKSKKRKYHGWINLSNLLKNGTAQCGWDDGDCNHSTHYGIGGYHNICPIGGFNGDLPWPAKLQFRNFNFYDITKSSKIKSIKVHFEDRMVAIDTGTGTKYDNFGPSFHQSKNQWVSKIYFTNGSQVASNVIKHDKNPRLSKTKFNSTTYTFYNIKTDDLLDKNFALNIEYNHNYTTNPGIIYLRNVYIDIDYESAEMYIDGDKNSSKLYTSKNDKCCTNIIHRVHAGYKNGNKVIPASQAPSKLGSKIKCIQKPNGVNVEEMYEDDHHKTFKIIDKTNKTGKKSIQYSIEGHRDKTVTLKYRAYTRKKPSYSFVTEYKSQEDFDNKKSYVVFKNGCASDITIYVDSIKQKLVSLKITQPMSATNLLTLKQIRIVHDLISYLSCGKHTLYIQIDSEPMSQVKKNKVIINVNPMKFEFQAEPTSFEQNKDNDGRYQEVRITRIDDEPKEIIPKIFITDETQPQDIQLVENIKKNDTITHNIDSYYSGEYYLSFISDNSCDNFSKILIQINSANHKQNYDYLFTRGEKGTAFDCDYLVAWEGDNIKEPLIIDDVQLYNEPDNIKICSESTQIGLSEIGLIPLVVKNRTDEKIEGIEIELNALVKNDYDKLEVTTSEWNDVNGIFHQLYQLFDQYNTHLNDNVRILNLTSDDDSVDEENVYLYIDQIDALKSLEIYLPFRSTSKKTVFLQYLLFEQPMSINPLYECENINIDNEDKKPTEIQIDVNDLMLTELSISGNTDLMILDKAFDCPDECYTTKDVDENFVPIDNEKSGGINYKITNVDTNNFENLTVQTKITNSPELEPYGYIYHDVYYPLLKNGSYIENQYDKTLNFIRRNSVIKKPMVFHNIKCYVDFPDEEEIIYTLKTNKNGLAEFFIPIPDYLNQSYTIKELIENYLTFEFKETNEYNKAVMPLENSIKFDDNKYKVILKYGDNYRRYQPGEIARIPVFLSANINIIEKYLLFNAQLNDNGSYDDITILYKICNLYKNEGIFTTTFETDDENLIKNKTNKKIYCGLDTDIDVKANIEKKIIESRHLNIINTNVLNKKKANKDVEVQFNLGKIPQKYLGNYDFININIKSGDYSIIEEDGNVTINWLIGEMNSFERQHAVITIQAKDIGLSQIKIDVFDYLHNENTEPIIPKQSKCLKCQQDENQWRIANSSWEQIDGIWHKIN